MSLSTEKYLSEYFVLLSVFLVDKVFFSFFDTCSCISKDIKNWGNTIFSFIINHTHQQQKYPRHVFCKKRTPS